MFAWTSFRSSASWAAAESVAVMRTGSRDEVGMMDAANERSGVSMVRWLEEKSGYCSVIQNMRMSSPIRAVEKESVPLAGWMVRR